jgi:GNAT superfamily N-acetyltransferase
MTTVTRRAESSDAERLGELHSQCWRELYSTLLPAEVLADLSPATMAGLWQRFVTRGERYVQYVAERDGQIVGFVGIGPGRETGFEEAAELYFIYVEQSAQRSGIGKQLLAAVPEASHLWIAANNRATQKFYRKNKFFPDSRRRVEKLFGTDLSEIRMSR